MAFEAAASSSSGELQSDPGDCAPAGGAGKPRLLIIGPTPPPYHGVAVAVDTLLRSRLTDEFEVAHLDLADRRGIAHVNRPDWRDVLLFLRQWLRLLRLLATRRPHLVYLSLSQTTIGFLRDSFFIWPSLMWGADVVAHLHAGAFRDWYDGCWAPMRWYVRAVLGRVSKMIVLGETLRSIFAGLLPDDRLAVVPNGVEVAPEGGPRSAQRPGQPVRMLHLTTLNRMKGTLILLAAIPTVLSHRRDVEFVFAGSWSHEFHRQTAEWYIARHRLNPFVRFLGQVTGPDKQACLRAADIFVFPGIQQEGQPLVVLEAMAAGLPIIFTNQGCLRETVVDGECGIETYTEDPYDLARRLCFMLEHPEIRRRLGESARRRCRQLFSRERHIDRMIQVFREVALERSRSAQAAAWTPRKSSDCI